MPEIKNTFMSGKMNKDLDERLVPNGEYRDAMNIQLSTSEGSDVGAIENILGNDILMGGTELDAESYCVGSIADDKNNALYWLIAGPTYLGLNDTVSRDMILQYKDSVVTPVVVDIYRIRANYGDHDDATSQLIVKTIDANGDPIQGMDLIEVGMVAQFDDAFAQVSYFGNNPIVSVSPPDPITGNIVVTLQNSFNIGILPSANQNMSSFIFSKPDGKQALNFHKTRLITGINILDDFLMFTDNFSEPKKLSISRCIEGSNGFTKNTRLIVPGRDITFNDNILLLEEHITVIKQAPLLPLLLNPKFDIPILAKSDNDEFFSFNSTSQSNELKSPGDLVTVDFYNFQNGIQFEVNDEIRFLSGVGQLPEDFHVRAKIVQSLPSNTYTILLLSVDGDTPLINATYDVYKMPTESPLFEKKFPRFSYRYKYQDGEYSTYAPFTDVVFEANSFEYDSKLAYNRGMENFIESLEIRGFIQKDYLTNKTLIPDDVVQIDILYKESDSPTVYVVDKIKYLDSDGVLSAMNPSTGVTEYGLNNWNANLYKINNDIIYSVVPSNQLLRPYDNVPRKALAQEITGNRLVFANYLQNFDLPIKPRVFADYATRYDRSFNAGKLVEYTLQFTNDSTEHPVIIVTEEERNEYKGLKTLKSIRDYQLGITYLDEYGRETPVFSSSDSNFFVKKQHASSKTKIITSAQTDAPGFAKGFKFYVKETDNRYYNLAMDRVYRAEDGNLWLSFPSSERNKVDEDTFLHLKKEIDSNTAVVEDAKYKIVSISNEAPLFIKTETKVVGSSSPGDTSVLLSTSPPVIGNRFFEIDEDTWAGGNNGKLTDVFNKMSLDFLADGFYSKRYKVVNFNYTANGGVNSGGVYRITLDRPIDTEDQWIYPNFPTVLSNNLPDFNSSLSLRIYQDIVEDKPEHEGKFFVKINGDGITEDRLIPTTSSVSEYEVRARMNAYMLSDSDANYQSGATTTGNARTNTDDDWEDALDVNDPEDGVIDSEWFLDAAYYPMIHQPTSGDKGSGSHVGDSNQNGGFGKGIKQETTGQMRWYMELAFSKLGPDMSDDQPFIGDPDSGNNVINASMNYADINSNYIWEVGKNSNPEHSNESKIVNALVKDSKFRFTGDTAPDPVYGTDSQIYTITDVQVIRRYNHTRWGMFDRDTNNGVYDIRTGSSSPNLHGFNPANSSTFNNLSGSRDGLAGPYFYFRHWKQDHNAYLDSDWDNPTYLQFKDFWKRFMGSLNRRTVYRIYLDKDPTTSSSFTVNGNTFSNPFAWGDAGVSGTNNAAANIASATVAQGIEFLQERVTEQQPLVSENPAIWETEPKDSIDLNIYHAASQVYPVTLDATNNYSYVPKGSILTLPGNNAALFKNWNTAGITDDTILVGWFDDNFVNTGVHIALNHRFDEVGGSTNIPGNPIIKFTRHDNSYTTLQFDGKDRIASLPYTPPGASIPISVHIYKIDPNVAKNEVGLSWFNAFSFSNGVESNSIRDIFNEKFIDKGPIVSTTLDTVYEEERRGSGLIYSGIYNTNSGVNNLNQFIQAEKITKDINPTYGSIQKLFSRNTDLISFCEDRVIRIQANKDAIFNADGNPQLIASNRVLGQTMPFSGDYGISKNPESFAADNYRVYFTDKQRSAVLRLSKDGITNISDYGMGDWFGDNLKNYNRVVGSFDADKSDYNLTLTENFSAYDEEATITYSEDVKGWVSFKSFIPENGLSLSNDYYTFKEGYLYVHHQEYVDRNTFYGSDPKHFTPSSVEVLLNAEPGSIKNYQTLNYEGSKSKITAEDVPVGVDSNEYQGYKNIVSNDGGWFTNAIVTNKEEGHVNEFIEKEGKWFNYIKGNTGGNNNANINTSNFSFQGVGVASFVPPPVIGCTDPAAYNYNPLANVNQGCLYPITGCCDPNATNNQNLSPPNICDNTLCTYANTWDCDTINGGTILITNGTGVYSTYAAATAACPSCIGLAGCTIQTDPVTGINNVNYDPLAVCDDGSCIACVDGCTDGTIGAPFLPDVYGFCINGVTPSPNTGLCDPNEGYAVNNYDPNATCDDGSCVVGLLGCTDPTALNYNSLATVDDGTCVFCTTPCCGTPCLDQDPAQNIHPDVNGDCRDGTNVGYPNLGGCGTGNGYRSINYDPNCNPTCPTNCGPPCIYGCIDPNALNYFPGANWDDGSCIFSGCTDPAGLNNLSNYVYIPNAGTSFQGAQIPLVSPGNLFSDNTQCCGGGYGNTSCGDCTALNYDATIGVLSQQGLINALCVDNSVCNYGATPPTVTMQKINHQDTTYSSSQILGFAGYSGSGLWNGMVAPTSTPSFDTIQKTRIKGNNFGYNNWYTNTLSPSQNPIVGVNSSLVYQPTSGPQITLADGTTADGKAVILNVIKQANQGGGILIKDVDFLPVWGPGNIVYPYPGGPFNIPWITTVHITGNGTCTENHDIFTNGILNTSLGPFASSNPGDGVMTVTLHVDMTDYNTNNNCNIADLMLTDSKSIIFGCMQPSAINYNANANVQDCSCVFV